MTAISTRDQNKFIVRLPEGMRDRIKAAAERNNRSMNAEIVATLEMMYPDRAEVAEPTIGQIDEDQLLKILDDVDRLRQRLLASATRPASPKNKADR
ncbi:Arc family DNA-binding protein [Sinorhizobium meliloti]|uniref:Arc family DNA-binding protein n=1 Tax=Rhizobium meliloti TaxID=382 RepID=UPI000FD480B6|nr:Arc family DNA-binding protein [Sinorhizobium meliloti]RVJ69767.1 Arc family DNA-binding protein [Sinorhizobium meliloti]